MSRQSINSGIAGTNAFMTNKYTKLGSNKAGMLNQSDYGRYCNKMKEIECCEEKLKECNECVVEEPCCPDPCDPCKTTSAFDMGWLGMLLLWFIIFTVLFWLIFYSLQPSWVLNADGTINTGKVLLSAIVSAIILVIIIWLIKSCICHCY